MKLDMEDRFLLSDIWNNLASARGWLGRNRSVLADRQIQLAQEKLKTIQDSYTIPSSAKTHPAGNVGS